MAYVERTTIAFTPNELDARTISWTANGTTNRIDQRFCGLDKMSDTTYRVSQVLNSYGTYSTTNNLTIYGIKL